jgi:hypothetical protein
MMQVIQGGMPTPSTGPKRLVDWHNLDSVVAFVNALRRVMRNRHHFLVMSDGKPVPRYSFAFVPPSNNDGDITCGRKVVYSTCSEWSV